jgi:hypothetical protein
MVITQIEDEPQKGTKSTKQNWTWEVIAAIATGPDSEHD